MGHKQISYISNGGVHKSDEIAEEEKYLRGRIDLCLSQHKLKFWTGIRQKIRCGMVLVGMDS